MFFCVTFVPSMICSPTPLMLLEPMIVLFANRPLAPICTSICPFELWVEADVAELSTMLL